MQIIWSVEADFTFNKELDFIYSKWTINEVNNYIYLVEKFIDSLKKGVLKGKVLNNNMRSFVISKQTTLFFTYNEDRKVIKLLLFWNNTQNPKKLKKILERL